VGEALQALFERCPGVRDRVLSEDGRIRQHVNVFVGDESVRFLGGLDAKVEGGVKITILPAVSGGR
jgi:molybdopterin synthase sulfur carrier subunit